ncbi:MAG: hypothetical protein ACRD3K_04200, partial [Edaphobacter sp.]
LNQSQSQSLNQPQSQSLNQPQSQFQSLSQPSIPVEGAVTSPNNTIVGSLSASASPTNLSSFREAGGPAVASSPDEHYTTTPPQQGIAPDPSAAIANDLAARSGLDSSDLSSFAEGGGPAFQMEDRGVYHVADAMKSMYDMGDSPSCATCGAIMTRSGSCYRCMSCGSTSGCS